MLWLKGYVIKEYFTNYFLHMSDVTFDGRSNLIEVHQKNAQPWNVTVVDTGEQTMTGGRLKRVQRYVGDESYCFTNGDGVCDVDISAEIAIHRASEKLATLTAVQPPGRYGALNLVEEDGVAGFQEKPQGDDTAGSMVVSSCSNRPYSTTFTPMPLAGRASPCNAWRRKVSSRPTVIAAFGSRWTPCVIGCSWRSCGKAVKPPGNAGEP